MPDDDDSTAAPVTTDPAKNNWGRIEERILRDDGTRVLLWTLGIAWIEWPDGSTITSVNSTPNPTGAEWAAFRDAVAKYVDNEISKRAARNAPATSARAATAGVGRPVFGVTPPPPGAVGKGHKYHQRKGK